MGEKNKKKSRKNNKNHNEKHHSKKIKHDPGAESSRAEFGFGSQAKDGK